MHTPSSEQFLLHWSQTRILTNHPHLQFQQDLPCWGRWVSISQMRHYSSCSTTRWLSRSQLEITHISIELLEYYTASQLARPYRTKSAPNPSIGKKMSKLHTFTGLLTPALFLEQNSFLLSKPFASSGFTRCVNHKLLCPLVSQLWMGWKF